jgi:type IV pilus assembly protein PilA
LRNAVIGSKNKGFSLVELIIVIAIMAVLIGILAPLFIRYVETSRQQADISAADNIAKTVKNIAIDPVMLGKVPIPGFSVEWVTGGGAGTVAVTGPSSLTPAHWAELEDALEATLGGLMVQPKSAAARTPGMRIDFEFATDDNSKITVAVSGGTPYSARTQEFVDAIHNEVSD